MEDYVVGIDFGASSVKAVGDKGERLLEITLNAGTEKELLNVICYHPSNKSGEIQKIVGKKAALCEVTEPYNVVSWIKRKLLLPNWSKKIPALGRDVSACEAATDIFAEVKRRISERMDLPQEIKAVLTVPVNFSALQRRQLKNIAKDSGIAVEQIITEPFAALFSLNDITQPRSDLVFVFDFGASTLDMSIIKIDSAEKFVVKELAAAGINLGGVDIDTAIIEKIIKPKYKDELDEFLASLDNDPDTAQQKFTAELMRCARAVKEEMFGGEDDEVEESIGTIEVTITLDEILQVFESERYREQIIDTLDELFDDLLDGEDGFTKEDITLILPFGGTSHIRYFMELLADYFDGKFDAENFSFDDDTNLRNGLTNRYMAVAAGAVTYKKIRDGGTQSDIEDVIPFRIGVEQRGKFVSCIGKNMPRTFKGRRPLNVNDIAAANWQLKIYQSFNANSTRIDDDGSLGVAFIGAAQLDRELYDHKQSILLEMSTLSSELLKLNFYQLQFIDGEHERMLVEEKTFSIGG